METLLKAVKYDVGLHLSIMALGSFAAVFHSADIMLNVFAPDYLTTKLEIKKDTIIPLSAADVKPEFPGGKTEYYKFLKKRIHAPIRAFEKGHEAIVFVRMTVRADGSLYDIAVDDCKVPELSAQVKNHRESGTTASQSVPCDPLFEQEAVRVIKSMPKWIPGKLRGSAVDVSTRVPVGFRLKQ